MKSLSVNTWEELFIQRTMDMTATMTMFCLQTQEEGPDMELVKKVSAVAGVMLLIVILCVVAMYLL